jgi:hypothetical protein
LRRGFAPTWVLLPAERARRQGPDSSRPRPEEGKRPDEIARAGAEAHAQRIGEGCGRQERGERAEQPRQLVGGHEEAAEQVFHRDCLIRLGTCLAPVGVPRPGQTAVTVSVRQSGSEELVEVPAGEIRRLPLATGDTAEVEIRPARGLDMGAGRGRPLRGTVRGGEVGLIIDGRGRPIQMSGNLAQWLEALEAYPATVV